MSKYQKVLFTSSLFPSNQFSQLNGKSTKYNKKKFHSSSIDSGLPRVKKPTENNKYSIKPNVHETNNSIDINISFNYPKNVLRSFEQVSSSLHKSPNKKATSYSMSQSSQKRNRSDIYDANIIHNNLNISLTNIASPKINNSYIVNPVLPPTKTMPEEGRKKFSSTKNNINIRSIKNLNEFLSSNSDKSEQKSSKKEKEDNKSKKRFLLTQSMNEKIRDCSNVENDLDKLNNKKFDIISNALTDFSNYVEPLEKEFLLNLLNHLNDIISFKNEQINELVKSNSSLAYKYFELKKLNDSHSTDSKTFPKKPTNYSVIDLKDSSLRDNSNEEKDDSSIEYEDLESIRFFDKIKMRTNSISHSKIPKLNLNFNNETNVTRTINKNKKCGRNFSMQKPIVGGYSTIAGIKYKKLIGNNKKF